MDNKKFLLLSLGDDRAKKIASAVSNSNCKKIVEFLSEKESATETQLSKILNIPLSTIHYNLEQLKKAGLIEWKSYHYSEKGKEVKHYSLANKYIVIAPKNDSSFFEKIKNFIPAFGVTVIGALGIGLLSYNKNFQFNSLSEASVTSLESQTMMARDIQTTNETIISQTLWFEPVLWFLLGSLLVILTLYLWNKIKKNY